MVCTIWEINNVNLNALMHSLCCSNNITVGEKKKCSVNRNIVNCLDGIT